MSCITKGALINQFEENERMHLIIVITIFLFNLYQYTLPIGFKAEQKQCTCECCLDNDENCKPTFRSTVNVNPLLECNNITCNEESCLIFSQCSTAFGY